MSTSRFDAVVIGCGLGGLTAGALLARAGYSVCLLERNTSLGGAASCYRIGTLTIEAALQETSDPRDPRDPKHAILKKLELLDRLTWLTVGDIYTVKGGPIGEEFTLPNGLEKAKQALHERFPAAKLPAERILERMRQLSERLPNVGASDNHELAKRPMAYSGASASVAADWQASLEDVFAREFGENEAVKCAIAANLTYYCADPKRLWWTHYASTQGGLLGSGPVFLQGGSRQLSIKLGGIIKRSGGSVLLGTAAAAIETGSSGEVNAVLTAARGEKPSQRIEASLVLANCSPYAAASMLSEQQRERLTAAFASFSPSISVFTAHFGLRANPARFGLRAYSTIILPSWMTALRDYSNAASLLRDMPAGKIPPLTVTNYGAIEANIDDGGPLLVTVLGADDISNWRGLSKGDEAARRAAWLDAILAEMERHYPGFAGAVSEKVSMNAAAVERYLATPGGAIYGFEPLPPIGAFPAGLPYSPKTLISGLYLSSAFAGTGGFSGAMAAGAEAAELATAFLENSEGLARP
ncbi:MAG: NAD(P)/FAD-dependent oxidoreductase [Rhodomicrobium sp.]